MGFLKRAAKPIRKDPADQDKAAGAREYNARVHERNADRLASAGDAQGAAAARAAADEARKPPARGKAPKR